MPFRFDSIDQFPTGQRGFGGTDKIGSIEGQRRLDASTWERVKRVWDLRHPHGKTLDDHISVEWFQYVARGKGMINPSILVRMKTRQVLLANVNHLQRNPIRSCRSLNR